MEHLTTNSTLTTGKDLCNSPAAVNQTCGEPSNNAAITNQSWLTKIGICPTMNRAEMQYVKARYADSLDKLPEGLAIQIIIEILNRSYAELGHVPVGRGPQERASLMKATAHLIRNDLLFHYPKVTLEEIKNAVRRGIRREYGDYYGFNAITVHEFVKKYLNSEDRLNALDKQGRYLNSHAPPEEITQEAKDELMKAGLKQCRETYRKTGRIIDFGNVNYQMLEESGEINLSQEEKQEIYREAQLQIKAEKDAQAVSFHQIVSRMRGEEKDDAAVMARAKEIMLRRYFDQQST